MACAAAARQIASSIVLLALGVPCLAATASVPSFSVGDGTSAILEYDLDLQPLRRFTGLHKPVDITSLPDGSIVVADEGARRLVSFNRTGKVLWTESFGSPPLRVRLRPGGGFLVTSPNEVLATGEDHTVEWRLAVQQVRTAVPLANGNVLLVRNDGQGWLVEMTPQGQVVWQSKPRGRTDESGRWIDESPEEYLTSVSSLDVGPDGTIFLTDFDRHQLRLFDSEHRSLRSIGGLHGVSDTRVGPRGELVAVSPEDFRVRLELSDGSSKTFQPPMRPISASISDRGTLLVGALWEPERAVMNATSARSRTTRPTPWWQHPAPVSTLAALVALCVAGLFRGPALRPGRERKPALAMADTGDPARTADGSGERNQANQAWTAFLVAVFAAGAYVAWSGIGQIEAHGFAEGSWPFALGCLTAGVALRLLNSVLGVATTLSSFDSIHWRPPPRPRDALSVGILCGLAAAALALCLYTLGNHGENEAIAVGLWLAAQIWIVAAAYSPQHAQREGVPRHVLILLTVILLLAAVTRFWQIGFYPDHVHHDHSIYGDAALQTQAGNWKPFFIRIWSVGRPWIAICAAALGVFGPHHWVLRLTAGVTGVLLVGATYLLATVLFNRRVGLVAALLVAVNNTLVLYSRLPYVIDPVAPFVFALYCAAVGLARGSRFHWCLSGVLIGWAVLGYYVAVTFLPVGGALLLYFLFLYPRWLGRNAIGLLWLLAGFTAVYAPMLWQTMADAAIAQRISHTVLFLNPDGSIRWDAALWAHQLGRSFGAILYYPDSGPWGLSTQVSICMRWGSCLFGVGLTYLLGWWRNPATFLLLAWVTLCIFLGSATQPNAPTHYHLLAAIVPLMITSAVGVDRALALTDRWRSAPARLLPLVATIALLVTISATQLQAVWQLVRRPSDGPGGQVVYRADPIVVAARYIRERPDYRHYLVRTRVDTDSQSPAFLFFATDSDLSDLSVDLDDVLPLPPIDPAPAASFIVLPRRQDSGEAILRFYPTARVIELHPLPGQGPLRAYVVDAEAVRQAYDARS